MLKFFTLFQSKSSKYASRHIFIGTTYQEYAICCVCNSSKKIQGRRASLNSGTWTAFPLPPSTHL